MFLDHHPEVSAVDLAKTINSLSVAGMLEMSKNPQGGLLYRAVKAEEASM